jgi:hypothetical protein
MHERRLRAVCRSERCLLPSSSSRGAGLVGVSVPPSRSRPPRSASPPPLITPHTPSKDPAARQPRDRTTTTMSQDGTLEGGLASLTDISGLTGEENMPLPPPLPPAVLPPKVLTEEEKAAVQKMAEEVAKAIASGG